MPRASQTDIAVLGALSMAPMTGYAVRTAIRTSIGHFWSESFGQIYPVLSGLVSERLVDKGDDGRFRLTAAGRHRLLERLLEPVEPAPVRNGVLLRVFFGRTIGPEACRRVVDDAAAQAEASLSMLATIRAGIEAEPDTADRPYVLLTVAAGETGARARLAWAEEARAVLASLPPG